jgi:hypothetical protein
VKDERKRHIAAIFGLAMWLAYPIAFGAGIWARRDYRCAGRTFTSDCFNDHLPILEFLLVALMLALTVEFARFAFSIFAPPVPERWYSWRLARPRPAAERYPLYQIIAGAGGLWAALHLWSIPLSPRYWYLLAYWLLWIGWFIAGALLSRPAIR